MKGSAAGNWSAFIPKGCRVYNPNIVPAHKVLKVILQCCKGSPKFACGLYDLVLSGVPSAKHDKPPFLSG